MAKVVIIISTKEKVIDDATKDTPITLHLKAYATEDPEKIQVLRDLVFIYPRSDKLNK